MSELEGKSRETLATSIYQYIDANLEASTGSVKYSTAGFQGIKQIVFSKEENLPIVTDFPARFAGFDIFNTRELPTLHKYLTNNILAKMISLIPWAKHDDLKVVIASAVETKDHNLRIYIQSPEGVDVVQDSGISTKIAAELMEAHKAYSLWRKSAYRNLFDNNIEERDQKAVEVISVGIEAIRDLDLVNIVNTITEKTSLNANILLLNTRYDLRRSTVTEIPRHVIPKSSIAIVNEQKMNWDNISQTLLQSWRESRAHTNPNLEADSVAITIPFDKSETLICLLEKQSDTDRCVSIFILDNNHLPKYPGIRRTPYYKDGITLKKLQEIAQTLYGFIPKRLIPNLTGTTK